MRAGQPMAGNHQLSIADDTLLGVPTARGDEAIENNWFQRRSRRGQRSSRFAESMFGQQPTGSNIEHKDARLGRSLRCAVCRHLPGKDWIGAGGCAQSCTGEQNCQGWSESAHRRSMRHAGEEGKAANEIQTGPIRRFRSAELRRAQASPRTTVWGLMGMGWPVTFLNPASAYMAVSSRMV